MRIKVSFHLLYIFLSFRVALAPSQFGLFSLLTHIYILCIQDYGSRHYNQLIATKECPDDKYLTHFVDSELSSHHGCRRYMILICQGHRETFWIERCNIVRSWVIF